jgi:hypothetical protein
MGFLADGPTSPGFLVHDERDAQAIFEVLGERGENAAVD